METLVNEAGHFTDPLRPARRVSRSLKQTESLQLVAAPPAKCLITCYGYLHVVRIHPEFKIAIFRLIMFSLEERPYAKGRH